MSKKDSKAEIPKVQDIKSQPQNQTQAPVEAQSQSQVQTQAAPEPELQPQAVPQVQVQQPQSATGPSGNNIKIIIVVIVVIALGISGYGLYNGSQIKSYAEKGEKMENQAKEWKKLFDDTGNAGESKDAFEKIKSDSEKNLTELEKTKAPTRAKELESNLKEYFTLSKKVAGELVSVADWATEIEKIGNDLSKMDTFDSSSTQAMASSMKKAKDELDKSIKKLKSMDVPKGLEEQHKAMQEYLEEISDVFGKMATALENEDYNTMSSLGTTFENKFSQSKIEDFQPDEALSDLFKTDVDKINELEKKIDEQVKNLKTLTFSF